MPETNKPVKRGAIRLRRSAKNGRLVYEQSGGNQSAVDCNGVSLDCYIHALFGLALQIRPARVLMIGCAGGTLATMLQRCGVLVTAVDIDAASFKIARAHFQLPAAVRCHVADGVEFLRTSRARYDAVVVDAFIGEDVPAQFTTDDFCIAARKRLRPDGLLLFNICLDGRKDLRADAIAARFVKNGWRVRVFDQPGGERNAIVLAGAAAKLKTPRLSMPPAIEAARVRRELKAMRFRRRRAAKHVMRDSAVQK